ncbi:MAG: hypothetical protein JST51_02615 [Armatimonadetes bacterium]|nr:hypothetical protein [Armatimonadota bacterium]
MDPKDVSYNWLSSGGAYILIFSIWFLSALFFAIMAFGIGREKQSSGDGCLLMISTTVFVGIGGAIGLMLLRSFFPWFIFSSAIGAIVAPMLVVRTFKHGKRRY